MTYRYMVYENTQLELAHDRIGSDLAFVEEYLEGSTRAEKL